ncbi:hypothetical protein BD626DRAFT_396064 [Schizophyllum amplum]|uniref:F-box domain-containing protein n=1 Tax=Schizophyllum amplum TaxID=97359 RepID=A0A550CRM1_9AGAR|nr:hypothetical protein BD626DRAFT_396064 [Auriculariopsis ampla]
MIEGFARVSESVEICSHCSHEFLIQVDLPPTPHVDLQLRAGLIPSATETRSIDASIQEAEECLAEAKEELDYLWDAMDALRYKASALEEVIARQRAYVAPIRRLPNEILSEIFSMACTQIDLSARHCVPVRISQVCKSWQDIMDTLPSAWTRFHLRTWQSCSSVRERRLLDLCLRKSKGRPFAQEVVFRFWNLRCFNVLKHYSDQWTSLDIDDCDGDDEFYEQFGDRPLSNLRKLEGWSAALVLGDTHRVFERRTPALRTVKLKDSHNITDEIPHLPWTQLTEIDIHGRSDYAIDVLSRCPNVASIVLHITAPHAEEQPRAELQHATLRELRTASITFDCLDGAKMLDHLTAPALDSLALAWAVNRETATPPDSGGRVPRFLGRSSCRLRELSLRQVPASERSCVTTTFRGLRSLTLYARDDMPLTDVDFHAFGTQLNDGTPSLLTDMEKLHIGGPGRFQGETVVGMLEARRAAGRPILEFSLNITQIDLDYFGEEGVVKRIKGLAPKVTVGDT